MIRQVDTLTLLKGVLRTFCGRTCVAGFFAQCLMAAGLLILAAGFLEACALTNDASCCRLSLRGKWALPLCPANLLQGFRRFQAEETTDLASTRPDGICRKVGLYRMVGHQFGQVKHPQFDFQCALMHLLRLSEPSSYFSMQCLVGSGTSRK